MRVLLRYWGVLKRAPNQSATWHGNPGIFNLCVIPGNVAGHFILQTSSSNSTNATFSDYDYDHDYNVRNHFYDASASCTCYTVPHVHIM